MKHVSALVSFQTRSKELFSWMNMVLPREQHPQDRKQAAFSRDPERAGTLRLLLHRCWVPRRELLSDSCAPPFIE